MALSRHQLYEKCLVKVNDQIQKYNEKLASLKESLDSIDRHNDYDEEGKLLGEYQQISTYLDVAQNRKKLLSTIDHKKYTEQVQFGSVVLKPKPITISLRAHWEKLGWMMGVQSMRSLPKLLFTKNWKEKEKAIPSQ
jgi:hypothetical protein